MTESLSSPPLLPSAPGYEFRWSGPALVIIPVSWRKKWLCDIQIDDAQKQGLKQALRELRPPALIVDLTDVPMLPAVCLSVLAMLAKEMDAVQHPGRVAIVGTSPEVFNYLKIIHFDKLFDVQ